MGEVVNLRQARKRARREAQRETAERNRALHAVPARERRLVAAKRELADRQLDASRRETGRSADSGEAAGK